MRPSADSHDRCVGGSAGWETRRDARRALDPGHARGGDARGDLHAEREPHVLFQASTIGALLDGAYDGDLSFAELAEQGDLGLGTLNGLDGEMIALDGAFYRADVEGRVNPVAPAERTPFAVVTRFEPTIEAEIGGPLVPPGPARPPRRADPRRRRLLRGPPRRRLRARPRPLGAAPAAALPAADRGRRRTARVRAGRGRRDDARLPLPELRRGNRGRRLPPALHRRGPRTRRPRPRLPRRAAARPARPLERPARRAAAGDRPRRPPASRRRRHAALARAEGG